MYWLSIMEVWIIVPHTAMYLYVSTQWHAQHTHTHSGTHTRTSSDSLYVLHTNYYPTLCYHRRSSLTAESLFFLLSCRTLTWRYCGLTSHCPLAMWLCSSCTSLELGRSTMPAKCILIMQVSHRACCVAVTPTEFNLQWNRRITCDGVCAGTLVSLSG